MCRSEKVMYEGSNNHCLAVTSGPVCFARGKLCVPRLNGIHNSVGRDLDDLPVPQCHASMSPSSERSRTKAVFQHKKGYRCGSRLQDRGMLHRKEPKSKAERDGSVDNRMSFKERVKSKFNLGESEGKEDSVEDPDDPYAFPDPVADPSRCSSGGMQSGQSPDPAGIHQSPYRARSPADGGISIAKLYPELAEKLERSKPQKPDQKLKGKVEKSSRTMNRLQTKIAQNKIKDKLKKIQDFPTPPHSVGSGVQSPAQENATSSFSSTVLQTEDMTPKSSPVSQPEMFSYSQMSLPLFSTPSQSLCSIVPVPTNLSSKPVPPSLGGLPATQPSLLPPPTAAAAALPWLPKSTSKSMLSLLADSPQTSLASKLSVLHVKPLKVNNILSEREAQAKLKTDSAVKFYSFHRKRKLFNHNFLTCGPYSSDEDDSEEELLPLQKDWFVPSSDEEDGDLEKSSGLLPPHYRTTKLVILRAQLRRQCTQLQVACCSNTNHQKQRNEATLALINALRDKSTAAFKALLLLLNKSKKTVDKYKLRGIQKRWCCYKNDNDVKCRNIALPYTNHCIKHIMYNVDQQLFDYCTAKFADNTQCCVPVFDINHDLPLCQEHAAKADNYQKAQNTDVKPKRPRKKPKPAALTRPPKKGKKKKKSQHRNIRPQKPVFPAEPIGTQGNTFHSPATKIESAISPSIKEDPLPLTESSENLHVLAEPESTEGVTVPLAVEISQPSVTVASVISAPSTLTTESSHIDFSKLNKNLVQDLGSVLDDGFSPDSIDKSFELPLEQASKLLEEQDFQEVLNKIPDEAFDIFSGRNGDYEPTREEAEELERALAAASKDVKDAKETLEKLSRDTTSVHLMDVSADELTKIADTLLNPNLASSSVAKSLSSGNGLSENLHQDNLNVIPTRDMTANSLSLPAQVINAVASSSASMLSFSRHHTGSLCQGVAVPSSLPAQDSRSRGGSLGPNNTQTTSRAVPTTELALTSARIPISHSLPQTSYSIPSSSLNVVNNSRTNSKRLATVDSASQLGVPTSFSVSHLSSPHTPSRSGLATHPALHISPLPAHLRVDPLPSSQGTPSIQMPSPAHGPPLSLQGIRPLWTAGFNMNFYNGLPSGRLPFVQSLTASRGAKYQLNSQNAVGQDMTSVAHSMGSSHGGTQTTGFERSQSMNFGLPPFTSGGST